MYDCMCIFRSILASVCREFGCTEHLDYFGYFKEKGVGGAVLSEPLENRQSGGGQSTGIDILSVRGSVQGRF